MTNKNTHTLIIPEEQRHERLDQALARLLPDYSRAQIQAWIKSGHVLVNGKTSKSNARVIGNESVIVHAQPKPEHAWEAQEIPLNIVFEDDDIIIINKPVGLVVHPGSGNQNSTMLNALLHHAPVLKTIPRAGIIHRLDKNTSGLLVIAKTPVAFKSLTHQLRKRTISREYQAIVYGGMISGGTVDAPISRHPLDRKKMAIIDNGKPAITHYRVAERFRAHTRLYLKLETGRTHQIRVHMAHIRHPIIGDSTYGSRIQLSKGMSAELIDTIRRLHRQALHAFALGFDHPTTHEPVSFKIDLPDDMQKLLLVLRDDSKKDA